MPLDWINSLNSHARNWGPLFDTRRSGRPLLVKDYLGASITFVVEALVSKLYISGHLE